MTLTNTSQEDTIEAYGAGIKLNKPFLALRTNFATIENNEIKDRRAGRSLTTKEAKELEKEINRKVKLNANSSSKAQQSTGAF